ncbi:MAG: D-aminoacyl-tRNA deacylase [Fimbriimonas sp.]
MRAIVQRVSSASVVVEGQEIGKCGTGLLLLIGVHREDTVAEASRLAEKIVNLRIFNDADGKMNLALSEVGGTILAISNFTVYGDTKKNRRPSFVESAPYEQGRELFDAFVARMRELGVEAATGEFGAHMDVTLVNDGPVTVVVDVP